MEAINQKIGELVFYVVRLRALGYNLERGGENVVGKDFDEENDYQATKW